MIADRDAQLAEQRRRVSLTPGAGFQRLLDLGFDQGKGGRERRVYIQIGGIEQGRIGGWLEGRYGALAIAGVTARNIGKDGGFFNGLPQGFELEPATMRPGFRPCIHKQLGRRRRANHRADIAPVYHRA